MVTNGDGQRSLRAPSTEDDDHAPDMPSQRAPCTVDSTVDVSQQRAPNVTPTEEFSDAFESEPSMVYQPAPDPLPCDATHLVTEIHLNGTTNIDTLL